MSEETPSVPPSDEPKPPVDLGQFSKLEGKVYKDGARHIYGVGSKGSKTHLSADAVLSAYGYEKGADTGPYLPPAQETSSAPEDAPEIAKRFNSLFEDLMLAHVSDVKHFENIPEAPTASLMLGLRISGERYDLSLRDNADRGDLATTYLRPSELSARVISLQRMDGEGNGREYWSYRLGGDGIIRRVDVDVDVDVDVTLRKDQARGSMNRGADTPTADEIQSKIDELTDVTLPNIRLEEDMGINNQPVSNDDIDGLIGFIGTA